MADVTQGDIASIQLESMKGFDRVNADILKSAWENSTATKDARYDVNSRIAEAKDTLSAQVDAIDDTLTAALAQVSRDVTDNRAQIAAIGYQVRDGFATAAKDAEINGLKTQIELAKQSTYLSDKIDAGNSKTQDLINELRDRELNRHLIERNTELVAALDDGRRWRGRADDGQFQLLASQLQAFQSQLQDTKQSMVNFGTMAGSGQTSTSNAVR
jgi:hypothetical protein